MIGSKSTMKSNMLRLNTVPAPPQLSKNCNEEIQRLNQDLNLLSQKLVELHSALPVKATSTSSFVNGMRDTTMNSVAAWNVDGTNFNEVKIQVMEKVIAKLTEIDRFVLRSTEHVDESDLIKDRRQSRGMDLTLLPTHLHLVDRLLDVYNKSQRVVVHKNNISSSGTAVKSGIGGNDQFLSPPKSSSNNNLQLQMQQQLVIDQQKQTIDSLEAAMNKLNTQILDYEINKDVLVNEKKMLQQQLYNCQKDVSSGHAAVSLLQLEIKELKNKLLVIQQQPQAPPSQQQIQPSGNEERLEEELNAKCGLMKVIYHMASKIKSHCDTAYINENDMNGLASDVKDAFFVLQTTIVQRLDELHEQINVLSTTKDKLEMEIKTYEFEREIVNKDINQLQSHNITLKNEKLTLEQELSKRHLDTNHSLQSELDNANDQLRQVHNELLMSATNISEIESNKEEINRLQCLCSTLRIESDELSCKYNRKVKSLTDELGDYKLINENLKSKIKELVQKCNELASNTNAGTNASDYLDSFEEVLREEMTTMKNAFEKKLKTAKQESEDLSRKHQIEINRMQEAINSSPSLSQIMTLKSLRNGSNNSNSNTSNKSSNMTITNSNKNCVTTSTSTAAATSNSKLW